MIDMQRAWVLLAAGLTGCAAHQARVFDAELKPFVGKNLTAITKYIGYPDTKLDVLGKIVYAWGTDVKVCKLQITTDPDGTIREYHWEGYVRDCAKFVDALDL
jgi:hypothetical protein